MPELPEVETICRQLDKKLAGLKIISVRVLRSGRETPRGQRFVAALVGKTVQRIERRAKLLIFRFVDRSALVVHLKMTGRLVFIKPNYTPTRHDRILFEFRSGVRLAWSDVRQFGFMRLVKARDLEALIAAYGPEPLSASDAELADRLRAPKTRRIKATLLDQTVIAGVGNIYADEALHRAGLRPTRRLASLSRAECARLAHTLKQVLAEAIERRGTSANDYVDARGQRGTFSNFLRVYGRAGAACPACATPIKKIVVAQRGTHFCPVCQT